MNETELRTLEMEALEVRAEGDLRTIRGYAAVFDKNSVDMGGFVERIRPGAFAKSIRTGDIRALWNHDPKYVLGRSTRGTLRLDEDEQGLHVEIDPPNTQWARDVLVSIERGDVSQMSIGFTVAKNGETWDQSTPGKLVRVLEQVNLLEVSPVTFAAYPQTSVSTRARARAAEIINEQDRPEVGLSGIKMWFQFHQEGDRR